MGKIAVCAGLGGGDGGAGDGFLVGYQNAEIAYLTDNINGAQKIGNFCEIQHYFKFNRFYKHLQGFVNYTVRPGPYPAGWLVFSEADLSAQFKPVVREGNIRVLMRLEETGADGGYNLFYRAETVDGSSVSFQYNPWYRISVMIGFD